MKNNLVLFCIGLLMLTSCSDNSDDNYEEVPTYPFVEAEFGTSIDLENLANYANQTVPTYITKNNSQGNLITDKGATLGRVLFYDKKLSSNNTISCSNCHIQANAFGDVALASQGVNGTTGRHSMRLINVRFANEGVYYDKINVDPSKINNPRIFTDEVFFNIDGITVATRKEDWEKIEQWNETGKKN